MLIAILIVVFFGAWLVAPSPKYLIQGRPVSAWLRDLEKFGGDKDPLPVFRTAGTNALPYLLEVMQERPSRLEFLIEKLNQMQSFVKIPNKDTALDHSAASMAINVMGTNALPGLPVLSNLFLYSN